VPSLNERLDRLWQELENIVEHLPDDDSEPEQGRRSHGRLDSEDQPIAQEEFPAEEYLYGRLVYQVSRRLRRYVEQQELVKVQEIWGELTSNQTYLEDPIPASLQDRGEMVLDQIQALTLRQEILGTRKSQGSSQPTPITLDLVDPLLLQIIAKQPELLRTLDWRLFEKLLAKILEELGYEIELQRGTKDGGVDIFALKADRILGPHRYLLQAKRWTNAVGVEPVRELLFLHGHHKITKSCLATTSRFTAGAWELARDYAWQLELRDFDKLQEWIQLSSHTS
jgi:HJR/Mrr/RecB family endonuclease